LPISVLPNFYIPELLKLRLREHPPGNFTNHNLRFRNLERLVRAPALNRQGNFTDGGISVATTPWSADIAVLRHSWGWLLALGIGLAVLGLIAIALVPVATVAAVIVLGWLMVVSGIIEAIHAFRVRRWSGGVLLHMIGGVLGILVGLLVVTHPVAGALVWTLLFASFFMVIGILRAIAAIKLKFLNWGWALFDGIVSFALGILLWAEWPWSGLWFLGLTVGISLLLRGWAYVMFALAVRGLLARQEVRRAA
jgi:uncharacterized membrane protein HdeD (DUF308 family)